MGVNLNLRKLKRWFGAVNFGFLGPKPVKNCMNLAKKLLPQERLTIIMRSSVVRINGYQSFDGTQDKSQD
jgi:hypothetical protein